MLLRLHMIELSISSTGPATELQRGNGGAHRNMTRGRPSCEPSRRGVDVWLVAPPPVLTGCPRSSHAATSMHDVEVPLMLDPVARAGGGAGQYSSYVDGRVGCWKPARLVRSSYCGPLSAAQ